MSRFVHINGTANTFWAKTSDKVDLPSQLHPTASPRTFPAVERLARPVAWGSQGSSVTTCDGLSCLRL